MINFDDKHTFYLVPKESLDELIQAVRDLKRLQEEIGKGANSEALGDYIPEDRAMELLGRGKTWFFNRRKSGELPGKKAAGRWYYKIADIQKYIENGRTI
ncbi:MAG: hypothetical protein AMS27_13925 [Bacteroides sp. SM23_62_1]|nr:MAG: hypothetical protein AMS27_13925 [Bacteroides sp. SM23_62_1]